MRKSWTPLKPRSTGLVGFLLLAGAASAAAAEAPPPPRQPSREELQREIQRLEDTIRNFQGQLEQIRNAIPPQASGVVTVPGGARQGDPFNAPAPEFGPSEWIPSWPPVRNPSPQARERLPKELGAVPPPLDSPLDYPQFLPGRVVVEHGLGPREVVVSIALLNADGTENLQVDPNRVVVTASSPPNGTFTITNYYEPPVTVRWAARRSGN